MMDPRPSVAHDLSSQVAIISGSGTTFDGEVEGIGSAIATTLASAGAAVLVLDRDPLAGQRTVDRINATGGIADLLVADVADPATGNGAVSTAIERFGDLSILVNNAAVTSAVAGHEMTPDEWNRVIGVNLTGAMMLCAPALRHFMKRDGGTIVNVGSSAGMRSFGNPAYAASKAGMTGLTIDLAGSYGSRGVRVNAVIPGTVETPMVRSLVDSSLRDKRCKLTALSTQGHARDVAAAVLYLCSEQARWITGAVLPVDGGLLVMPPSLARS